MFYKITVQCYRITNCNRDLNELYNEKSSQFSWRLYMRQGISLCFSFNHKATHPNLYKHYLSISFMGKNAIKVFHVIVGSLKVNRTEMEATNEPSWSSKIPLRLPRIFTIKRDTKTNTDRSLRQLNELRSCVGLVVVSAYISSWLNNIYKNSNRLSRFNEYWIHWHKLF